MDNPIDTRTLVTDQDRTVVLSVMAHQDWETGPEIAEAIRPQRLEAGVAAVLATLRDSGQVEMEIRRQGPRNIPTRYWRIKPQ